jgi:hypothetical protein
MTSHDPLYRCIGCGEPLVWLDDEDGYRWEHEKDRTTHCEQAPQQRALPGPPSTRDRGPRTRGRWNLDEPRS